MKKFKRNCVVFGASSRIGQPKAGVEAAPAWLRHNEVLKHLDSQFQKVIDRGDFAPETLANMFVTEDDLNLLSTYSKTLAQNIQNDLAGDNFVITLGGDHSIACGTLAATHAFDENIKIVWVDAHADINTFRTSPTGNTHGMPLAWHLHLMSEEKQKPFSWLKKLKKENLVYLGLRDVDQGEQDILNNLGIKYYTADDVKEIGITQALSEIDEHFSKTPGDNIHISFDVDGIDPKFFPATGTPVGDGLSLNDGKNIISHFCENYNLIALDLVEINPALGDTDDITTTIESTKDLISSISNEVVIRDEKVNTNLDTNTVEKRV